MMSNCLLEPNDNQAAKSYQNSLFKQGIAQGIIRR